MKEIIGGIWLSFSGPEGTTVDGVVVSASGKPDDSPGSNWTSMGDVGGDGMKVDHGGNEVTVQVPQTGGLYIRKTIEAGLATTLTFQLNQLDKVALGMIWGLGALPTSGAAVAPFKSRRIRGWWRIEIRAQTGAVIAAADVWGAGRIDNAQFHNNVTLPALIVEVEPSALNTLTPTII